MEQPYDVFISYARADATQLKRLYQALIDAGLRVWRDQREIEAFSDIQAQIRDGLSHAKTLLAFYSKTYTQRRACDWELVAAFLAGGKDRILVINPEAQADHIQPQALRENLFATPADLADPNALAAKIKTALAKFKTCFGELPQARADQAWVGLSPNGGAENFVGRWREIWQIHNGLAAGSVLLAPTTTGMAPARARPCCAAWAAWAKPCWRKNMFAALPPLGRAASSGCALAVQLPINIS